ncbi:MAG: site-specific DNA-methyltransferase [Meiothermus sp.]|nr:site-specific DNA-methyltransferase [Meiothermus sp.]
MFDFEHTDALSYMARMANQSFDHIITDPPYSEAVHAARANDTLEDGLQRNRVQNYEHMNDLLIQAVSVEFARLARRWVLVFCDIELVPNWKAGLTRAGLNYVRTGIWVKENPPPQFSGDRPGVGYECYVLAHRPGPTAWNGGGRVAVHHHLTLIDRKRNGQGKIHPAEKPLSLMEELIAYYTNPAEHVLDPFAGVATTGVAALRLGRHFYGCETNEGYYKAGLERLNAASMVQSLFLP